jgi:hypothetical protein
MKRELGYLQIGEDSDAMFAHGQSAFSFHASNITLTYYMQNAIRCKLISSWHQGISAQAHPSVLCCHTGMMWAKRLLQTCTLLNNINNSMARNKMTNAVTMTVEEWERLSSGDSLIAVSQSWEIYNTYMPYGCIILCKTHMQK